MARPFEQTDLVARAQQGDTAARDQLVEAILPELRGFVRLNAGQRVRQLESESDLVQTICREAFDDLAQYRGSSRGQFRKWLFTIALNKIQMKGRHHAAEKRDAGKVVAIEGAGSVLGAYANICSPSRQAAAHEELARVEAAFDELPEDQRDVLNLVCIMGLSHREAAEQLGRSETATRKLLSRARARLALYLATTK